MRAIALLFLALPAAAAPLPEGAPRLSLRLDAICGWPSTRRGIRAGGGFGVGYRVSDQVAIVADLSRLAALGGGVGSAAEGLQATLDSTPLAPYLELAMVELTNRNTVGYSLAMRASAGADWQLTRAAAFGLVVRTFVAFDPEPRTESPAGVVAVLRLVLTPGAM